MASRRARSSERPKRRRLAQRAQPTVTQVEMIERMNGVLGTSYAVPATERDAQFLIDGMVDEERQRKRGGNRLG